MAADRKAAHRKPRQRLFTGPAARTAATLALAGAATATALEGSAQADPQLTTAQVRAKVDRLYHDAEVATEKYNGAKEQSAASEKSLDALRDEAARRTARLNTARDALGSWATAQYRSAGIDPAVRLALSSDPDEYLERASFEDRAGDRQAGAVNGVRRQIGDIAQLRARAQDELAVLASRRAELKKQKDTVRTKLADARKLLATLTADQRAAYERSADAAHGGGAVRADRSTPAVRSPPPTPARPRRSTSRTGPSGSRTSGAPPGPPPSTAQVSPRRPGGRRACRCPGRRTPRSTRVSASRVPNWPRGTWCSSTPGSPMSGCTSAAGR